MPAGISLEEGISDVPLVAANSPKCLLAAWRSTSATYDRE
jgi:hypothetical protein